ncbi:MAG: hypothetical protein AB1791_22525, partial [Chloroflexota bacterium]
MPELENPQQFNRYSYGLNNPLRYTDPSGHCVMAFPFDTIVCVALVVLTVAIDHQVNRVEPANLESNAAQRPITSPNLVVDGAELSAGVLDLQGLNYYHLGSDTFATAACLCSGPSTPNAGWDASFSLASTDASDAATAASGFTRGIGVSTNVVGGSFWSSAVSGDSELPTPYFAPPTDNYTSMPQSP